MREAPSNAGSASWGETSKSLRFSTGVVDTLLPSRAEASTSGIFTMAPFYAFMPVAGVFFWLDRVVVAVDVAVVVRGDVLVGDLLAIDVGAGDVADGQKGDVLGAQQTLLLEGRDNGAYGHAA